MKNELGAKWRRGWVCSTDQWSRHPYIPNAPKERGVPRGGGGRERERATHGKIEEKTGVESQLSSVWGEKQAEKVLDISLRGPNPVFLPQVALSCGLNREFQVLMNASEKERRMALFDRGGSLWLNWRLCPQDTCACCRVRGWGMWCACRGSSGSRHGEWGPHISLCSRQRPLMVRLSSRLSTMTPGPRKESARRWIRSSRERWQAAAPLHTRELYTMSGRTKPLYVVSRPGMLRTADALRRKPIRWAAHTATVSERRCWPKLNDLSKVTPRSLSVGVRFFHSDTIKLHGIEWPWTEMSGDSRGLRLWWLKFYAPGGTPFGQCIYSWLKLCTPGWNIINGWYKREQRGVICICGWDCVSG